MYFYAENNEGKRVPCWHPAEARRAREVLPAGLSQEAIRARTGFNSRCVCLDCCYQFDLDLGESYPCLFRSGLSENRQIKDKRECPKCKSENVKTGLELVGETCPKCKEGVIEEIWTGTIS